MAWGWQLWLSPRPPRSVIASDSYIMSPYDGARFEFFKDEQGQWAVREIHYIDNPWVKDGHSGPPLHIHWKQTEYFQVEQGVIGIHKNGKQLKITKDDGIVTVPAGTRHKFWSHESNQEDLIFKVWAEPQGLDNSFDEKFIRNLIGYQRDCYKANMQPSIFQLALISYDSATLATPPFWVPIWLLSVVQYVMAYWVGGCLLGPKVGGASE
ncbi:conserved hypothetical protein [Talaromyces stipitatus ATCC 10500]|uniref:Cupin 2 conserved barrel domain-containing protein n=1 Tax=Talaromyces stipitatus (strain ATCC 10500 / CBS 375.48 / QM 6759 / NRRL 1006) TaxID=441959 RepID=B8M0H1_TALSN|nr:uncharacterized protein TSTA_084990 [Talaromyces stipitatus ATCC 10500]EED21268.1 conserved hypothetical protein [Talaromyces stipitatus ATCC 10500]